MSVRGLFASYSSLVGDRQGNDFAGRILMNGYGGTAPMLALSSGMPKESVRNTEFSWVEDAHISGSTLATAGIASGVTALVVADANIWIPNSIILNQVTGEQMYITAISGNTCTIVRGFAGTLAAAITTSQALQLISTAFGEATEGAAAVTQVGESRTNYIQIFKRAFEVSNTAKAVEYQTGAKLAESKQNAMTYMMEDIERAFMFGRPSVSVISNKQVRTSGGIRYNIETYGGKVVSAADNSVAGRLNLDTINDFIRSIFDRNIKGFPNERLTFCGSAVLQLIQKMVADIGEYSITQNESAYGLKVTKLTTFNGDLTMLTHPMFVENPLWNRELWAMHPAGIKRKVLRDFSVIHQTSQYQNNALDSEKGHLLQEMGFEVKGVKTMGIISNIQTAGGIAALPTT